MTCAICLEQIQLENTAYVVGCEHAYCGDCSLLLVLFFLCQACSEGLQEHLKSCGAAVHSTPVFELSDACWFLTLLKTSSMHVADFCSSALADFLNASKLAAKCILQWAELRDSCSCPQCKKPFSRLLTYRTLDGTMSDFPVEESVCLLKRATWVQDQMKVCDMSLLRDCMQCLNRKSCTSGSVLVKELPGNWLMHASGSNAIATADKLYLSWLLQTSSLSCLLAYMSWKPCIAPAFFQDLQYTYNSCFFLFKTHSRQAERAQLGMFMSNQLSPASSGFNQSKHLR